MTVEELDKLEAEIKKILKETIKVFEETVNEEIKQKAISSAVTICANSLRMIEEQKKKRRV